MGLTDTGVIWGYKFNRLTFRVPNTTGYFPNNNRPEKTSRLSILSNSPNKVTINWGDGSALEEVDFIANGSKYDFKIEGNYHTFNGTNSFYNISFSFEKPEAINLLTTFAVNLGISFPNGIINLIKLESLNIEIGSGIENFPENLSALEKLTNLKLQNASLTKIDESLLNLNLESLDLALSINLSDFTATNFNKINRLQNTLKNLGIRGSGITTLPSEILELDLLERFDLSNLNFTILPINIPENISELVCINTDNLTSWERIDRLTNLNNILFRNTSNSLTQNPITSEFLSLTKLKTVNVSSSATRNGSGGIDVMIEHWYNFTTNNATKDTSQNKFRNMIFNNNIFGDDIPSGTYQQPANYNANVSNGNPASSQEYIWVMVHQYEHQWTHSVPDGAGGIENITRQ